MRITPDFGRLLPAELKQVDQWLVWRREKRHGKDTKVPYDSRTKLPGSVTDPGIYLSFERALAVAEADDFWQGIGFAVTAADAYCGVDLDHCLDDQGVLAPWAREVIEPLDSYTEVTPSGTGLRVWIKAKLLPKGRRKGKLGDDASGNIEFYDGERYFTVTGNRYARSPEAIHERQAELDAVHRKFWPEKAAEDEPRPRPPLISMTDRDILEKMFACSIGREIRDLFDGVGIPEDRKSEADYQLCRHLAHWTGGDIDAIDRLFRQSAICRKKWLERPDYRELTIRAALDATTSFYDPNYRRADPPRPRAAEAPAAAPPDGPDAPGRQPGEDGGDDGEEWFRRTDKGNAMRLVALHGDDLRHCHPWKSWLAWEGDRWKVNETGLLVRKAFDVVERLHVEAEYEADEKKRKKKLEWALKSEAEARINAMISLARSHPAMPVLPDDFDRPPYLLNCPNGTVDLETGRLRPHIRAELLTKRAAARFDAGAPCPHWDAFLRRVMGGDDEMIGFLRRAVGYAATGSVREHALFFLYGHGRNGKSTFLNTLLEVLGDYAITVNADLLVAKNNEDHPTGVADLQGRRFVATIEVEDGRRLAESLVKTLTSEDKIRARRMRQDFFEFDPTHKLFLAANHKPVVRGTDDGIWRRIKLVPFKVQIPEAEVDKALPDKLRAEAPGIMAWIVRGAREWLERGLDVPEEVLAATKDYRSEMDYLGDFLGECCEVGAGYRVVSRDLYLKFSKWCDETGGHAPTSNKFGRTLTDRGFGMEKSNGAVYRTGLRLQEAHLPLEPDPSERW